MQLKASVAGVTYLLYIEAIVSQNIVAWNTFLPNAVMVIRSRNLSDVRRRAVLTGMGGVGYDQIFVSRPCFGCDSRAPTLQLGKDQLYCTRQVLDQ
jgi:hypothetical protein